MAVGGPAAFGIGLFRGLAQSQSQATERTRGQLNEALRLRRERTQFENQMRQNQEAIAKENLVYQRAQAEAGKAQSDYDLVQARIAQIKADPGAPFKDSAIEGRLAAAHERLSDAHENLQESQGKLQDLIASRDERVRAAIPAKTGGVLGFGQRDISRETDTPLGSSEYKRAIVAGDTADTSENRDFSKSAREEQREIERGQRAESRERANVAGDERALEVGRSEQGPINEEKRQAKLFPLEKESRELQTKKQESLAGAAAAIQEIQARQQQAQQTQQEQQQMESLPGYQRAMQGGAATGKGGGTGGLLGAPLPE